MHSGEGGGGRGEGKKGRKQKGGKEERYFGALFQSRQLPAAPPPLPQLVQLVLPMSELSMSSFKSCRLPFHQCIINCFPSRFGFDYKLMVIYIYYSYSRLPAFGATGKGYVLRTCVFFILNKGQIAIDCSHRDQDCQGANIATTATNHRSSLTLYLTPFKIRYRTPYTTGRHYGIKSYRAKQQKKKPGQ